MCMFTLTPFLYSVFDICIPDNTLMDTASPLKKREKYIKHFVIIIIILNVCMCVVLYCCFFILFYVYQTN